MKNAEADFKMPLFMKTQSTFWHKKVPLLREFLEYAWFQKNTEIKTCFISK